jgi:hypothetical protein
MRLWAVFGQNGNELFGNLEVKWQKIVCLLSESGFSGLQDE